MEQLLRRIDGYALARAAIRETILTSQAVEDCSEDVLTVVAERVGQWEGLGDFRAWLRRIARDRATDDLRGSRPTDPLPDQTISDQLRSSSLIATRAAVTKLAAEPPADYRHLAMFQDIEQGAYSHIAKLLEMPPATVRTRVSRGRAMLHTRRDGVYVGLNASDSSPRGRRTATEDS